MTGAEMRLFLLVAPRISPRGRERMFKRTPGLRALCKRMELLMAQCIEEDTFPPATRERISDAAKVEHWLGSLLELDTLSRLPSYVIRGLARTPGRG